MKLRGAVQQMVGATWVSLKRGDIVPDDRFVRTLADGHVDFQRNKEIVTLAPGSLIQIIDRSDEHFTTIRQAFGSVEVEAEVEHAPHFSVETPYLAAVVKGTHFIVRSGGDAASVTVQRGMVAVESLASHSTAMITVGQTATVGKLVDFSVSGSGTLPVIVDANGQPVANGATLDQGAPANVQSAALGSGGVEIDLGRDPGGSASKAGQPGGAGITAKGLSASGSSSSGALVAEANASTVGGGDLSGNWGSSKFGWVLGSIGLVVGTIIGVLLLVFRRFLNVR